MGRLVVQTFLTIDGVMQAPGTRDEDRDGGFEHGGWVVPFFDEATGDLNTEWMNRAEALLFGRKTYEAMAAHWPHLGDEVPIAKKFNSVPKYVASRTRKTVEWNNSTLLEGDIAESVAELKARIGGELQVAGSCELVQTLMKHDLVDEYRLWTAPVILGRGKRLFADGTSPSGLRLLDTRTTSTSVTINTYERAGEVEYASWALDE